VPARLTAIADEATTVLKVALTNHEQVAGSSDCRRVHRLDVG
jgi:hypothetical protein